jgi:NDP-sugar pyrophosphorylase family protein
MTLPIAILAGGLATRLRPVTEKIPKSLVDVAGRPFAAWQLDLLKQAGAARVVFCVGYLGDMVKKEVGDGSRWNLDVRYVFDGPTLLGTGGALRRALPELGDRFLVLYGDSFLDCDYAAVERAFLASGKQAVMTVLRNDDQWDRSNVEYRDGRIVAYEKQDRTPAMRHIDYGLGGLTAAALLARPADQPFDLAGVYRDLARQGEVAGFEVANRFYEIGSPEGLAETRALLAGRPAAA